MIPGHAATRLDEALADTPVVYLQGARQTGKSTLAKDLGDQRSAPYLTLDTAAVLAAAADDPDGFVAGLPRPVVIDEAQRAPALAVAIKATVNADRQPGQFLLTGSAGVMSLPKLSDSLAGRMDGVVRRGAARIAVGAGLGMNLARGFVSRIGESRVQGPSWSISSSRASAALAVASAERVTASVSASPTAATTPILRSPASTGAPTGGGPPTVR